MCGCAANAEITLDALTSFPAAKLKQRDTLLLRGRIHFPTIQCLVPVYPTAISAHPSWRKVTCIYLQEQTGDCSQLFSTTLQGIVLGKSVLDESTSAQNDGVSVPFIVMGVD